MYFLSNLFVLLLHNELENVDPRSVIPVLKVDKLVETLFRHHVIN